MTHLNIYLTVISEQLWLNSCSGNYRNILHLSFNVLTEFARPSKLQAVGQIILHHNQAVDFEKWIASDIFEELKKVNRIADFYQKSPPPFKEIANGLYLLG